MAIYVALLISVNGWSAALRQWLDFRRHLYQRDKIPTDFELHAVDLVRPGKGRPAPSVKHGVNSDGRRRKRVLKESIEKIGQLEEVGIVPYITVGGTPEACYVGLVGLLERWLGAEGGWAIAVVDGDGVSQPYLYRTHRQLKLASRRVVEDAWPQGSHVSQLVQMADIAAYSFHQAHKRRESRKFMWDWYQKYLHVRELPDCCGCPKERTGPEG